MKSAPDLQNPKRTFSDLQRTTLLRVCNDVVGFHNWNRHSVRRPGCIGNRDGIARRRWGKDAINIESIDRYSKTVWHLRLRRFASKNT